MIDKEMEANSLTVAFAINNDNLAAHTAFRKLVRYMDSLETDIEACRTKCKNLERNQLP